MLTFKILGPLEVVRDGAVLPLGPPKQRALLAYLLLHPERTVSSDRLKDALWAEEPAAKNAVHQLVFRLRRVLGDTAGSVLVTRPPGYLIHLGSEDVLDAAAFEGWVQHARDVGRDDPGEARRLLDEALALWRGDALADVVYEGFAQAEARRLEELRAAAEESRIEALMALGRENDAILALDSLVQRYPLRERVRAQQMLALYRAGRQSEALGAFQTARQTLASELGIDPGPELQALEAAILRQDPDLRTPAPAGVGVDPAATTVTTRARPKETVAPAGDGAGPDRGRRRSRLVLGGAIVMIGLAIVVAAFALRDGSSTTGATTRGSTGTTAIDADVPSGTLHLDWHEAYSGDFIRTGDQRIVGGVKTPTGFVVFGFTAREPEPPKEKQSSDTAVWVGTSDQKWSSVSSPSFVGLGNQRATDAVVFGDDAIVLFGSDSSGGDFDAAAWLQASGSDSWIEADIGASGVRELKDQTVRDVVRAGPALFVVGSTTTSAGRDAAVWHSKGGTRWTLLDGAPSAQGGDQEMTSVTWDPERKLLVAAGFSHVDRDLDAAVWISNNGFDWHLIRGQADLRGPGEQKINSMTFTGSMFIAVGEETTKERATDAVVWTSPDGRTWTRVLDTSEMFGGDGEQRMFAVASSDLGIVAAGSAVVDERDRWDAAVWTSVDGVHWDRLPGDDPSMTALADIGHQEIKGLIPTEDGFLALGAEAEVGSDWDARVWIGTLVQ